LDKGSPLIERFHLLRKIYANKRQTV